MKFIKSYKILIFYLFFLQVDKMLAEDIAKLMTLIPNEEMKARQDGTDRIGKSNL